AEFLAADLARERQRERRQHAGHDAHRGRMPPLRCASRPRVRRWPGSHRAALLHEFRGAEVRAASLSYFVVGSAYDRYTPPPEPLRSLPPPAKTATYCRPSTW